MSNGDDFVLERCYASSGRERCVAYAPRALTCSVTARYDGGSLSYASRCSCISCPLVVGNSKLYEKGDWSRSVLTRLIVDTLDPVEFAKKTSLLMQKCLISDRFNWDTHWNTFRTITRTAHILPACPWSLSPNYSRSQSRNPLLIDESMSSTTWVIIIGSVEATKNSVQHQPALQPVNSRSLIMRISSDRWSTVVV